MSIVQVERRIRELDRVLLMMRRSIRDKELAVRKSSVRIDERARHLNMDVCSDALLQEFVTAFTLLLFLDRGQCSNFSKTARVSSAVQAVKSSLEARGYCGVGSGPSYIPLWQSPPPKF